MSVRRIQLVEVGEIDPRILDFLRLVLSDSFSLPCEIRPSKLGISPHYNPLRDQYYSTQILGRLHSLAPADAKILGVTGFDLFIPILTFVFGEAQLSDRAALVSVHRLYQTFYGLPEDDELFLRRCEKEALHELGHTFGLLHCSDYECVMNFSNSIEEVDLKTNTFCSSCGSRLPVPARAMRLPPW